MVELADHGFVVNVEGAVVRDGEYLFIERGADEEHAAGLLGFPGGKVERTGDRDDALEAALRREIEEEVGLSPAEVAYVQSNEFEAVGVPCLDVVFICRHGGGTPERREPGEVAALRWLSPEEAIGRDDCPPWIAGFVERIEERRAELGW